MIVCCGSVERSRPFGLLPGADGEPDADAEREADADGSAGVVSPGLVRARFELVSASPLLALMNKVSATT